MIMLIMLQEVNMNFIPVIQQIHLMNSLALMQIKSILTENTINYNYFSTCSLIIRTGSSSFIYQNLSITEKKKKNRNTEKARF